MMGVKTCRAVSSNTSLFVQQWILIHSPDYKQHLFNKTAGQLMKHRRVTNIVTARLIAKNALSAIILFFSKVQIDFQFISLSCPEAHQTSSEKPVCLVSPAGAEQCRWNIYNILSLGSSHPARWCRPAQTRECASQWSASIIPQN